MKRPSDSLSIPATFKSGPKQASSGKATSVKIKVSSGPQKKPGFSKKPGPPKKPGAATPAAHQPSSYRLFYALRVPAEVATPLAQAQAKLRGNWRAVRADQMHVTLSYLPAVPPERVEDLKQLGKRLAQNFAPLDISLRGTGYFPNEGSPRVWFVKTEAERLNELAEALRAGIQELGLQTDDLPFKAHITLARKKGPAPRLPPLIFEEGWTAPGLTLYRSFLQKTGPVYEVQSTFRFAGLPTESEATESISKEPTAPSAPQEPS